ncbi:unnamed protein product [Larinioides sclopetarius]|uniref:Uncharacterized protein n=1 Tax=Larinioides sclopetarius TaxID=280406 RepID=A0AAV2AMK4_9ARAC
MFWLRNMTTKWLALENRRGKVNCHTHSFNLPFCIYDKPVSHYLLRLHF